MSGHSAWPGCAQSTCPSCPTCPGKNTDRVQEHRSFPSIVMWVVFNEGWGQYDTEKVVQLAQALDSSRLVDPASGWVDVEVDAPLCQPCC